MANATTQTYQPLTNREYKSTVFTTYFSNPEHAASLYRSLIKIPTPEFYVFLQWHIPGR